jgi:hypothetical protein
MKDFKYLREEKQPSPDAEWVHCLITVFMVWAVMLCVAISISA